nr:hypothetical protein [uncultured bacterium]
METPLSPFTLTPDPPESDFFEKYRYYIFGGLLLILSLGVYLMLTPPRSTLAGPDIKTAGEIESIANSETANPTNGKLVVDIAGAVIKPGVYWLDAGKIVEDAINSAGGFSRRADLDAIAHSINRAQELTNHGKIYIPKIGESYVPPSNSNVPATNITSESGTKININSAESSELELLPGIGPVLAQRIIDYRLLSGPFKSIDGLMDVPGIGDSIFGQLKDLVTV